MEYNIYLWLQYLVKHDPDFISFSYEPELFHFKPNQYNCTKYVPDFKVITKKGIYYLEVKGYMDFFDSKKIYYFKRDYPYLKLRVIDRTTYNQIKRKYKNIIDFE